MWEYEHSVTTDTTAEAIWRLYSDPSSWPAWDAGIEHMELDGPFAVGTTGRLTPVGQDSLPFTLIDVVQDRRFVDETHVAGLVLRFIHTLVPEQNGGTTVTHRVEITGSEADQLGPQIGPKVTAGIPETIETLVKQAQDFGTN